MSGREIGRRDFLRATAMAGAGVLGASLGTWSSAPAARSGRSMMTPDEVRHHLTGPVTSIFMPFTRDGAIDERSLRGMIDRDIQNGSRSIILTAGDSMYNILTDDEADRVTRITVEQTAGRAMVVAADKSWWLGREIEWARRVREIGADMLMARPPGGIVEPEAFVEYYREVARHIPVMVVTNVFDRDEMDFNRRTIEMVRDRVDGVMAMKDDLIGDFITQVAPLVHGEWAVMSGGQMKNHLFTLPYGCDGFMDVFRMLNPDISDRYWAAIQAEDLDRAQQIVDTYDQPFFEAVLSFPGFRPGMHAALEIYGIAQRWHRKPLYSLTDEQVAELRGMLEEIGLV